MSPPALRGIEVDALARAISQGAIPLLERLHMSWKWDERMAVVFDALAQGGCPNLKTINAGNLDESGGDALARALSSGHCQRLEELDIVPFKDRATGIRILEAIRNGACLHLCELDIGCEALDTDGAKLLGEALGAGACRELEYFDLSGCEFWDEGLVRIMEGIKQGKCCSIKSIALPFAAAPASTGPTVVHAMAQAIKAAPLRNLDFLWMGGVCAGDDVVLVRTKAWPT